MSRQIVPGVKRVVPDRADDLADRRHLAADPACAGLHCR